MPRNILFFPNELYLKLHDFTYFLIVELDIVKIAFSNFKNMWNDYWKQNYK